MRKLCLTATAVFLAAGTIAIAATPADTITARQANFKQMGRAFKAMSDEMRKPAPVIEVFQTNSQALNQAARHVGGFFPRGTGAETGIKTGALPAIWERNRDFRGAARTLVRASQGLRSAARSGDIDRIKAAFGPLGGSCKACHDNFRARG